MICVYSAPALPLVALLHERFTAKGIRCLIRNQFLGAGAGELPPHETWPQLCIFNADDEARARALVAEFTDTSAYETLPAWQCRQCGADNEAIFGFCWQCQAPDQEKREPVIE